MPRERPPPHGRAQIRDAPLVAADVVVDEIHVVEIDLARQFRQMLLDESNRNPAPRPMVERDVVAEGAAEWTAAGRLIAQVPRFRRLLEEPERARGQWQAD